MPKYTAPLNIEYDDGKSVEQVRKELEAAINDLQLAGIERDKKIAKLEQDMISMQSAISAKQVYNSSGSSSGGNGTTLLEFSDLTYEGSFRLSSSTVDGANPDYGGYGGAWYYPTNNSIFLTGRTNDLQVIEYGIPTLVDISGVGAVTSDCNAATGIQGMSISTSDISNFDLDLDQNPKIGGIFIAESKIWMMAFEYYDGDADGDSAIFHAGGLTFSGATYTGFYSVGPTGYDSGKYSHHAIEIPAAKQAKLGGYKIALGTVAGPIITRYSSGPAFIAIDPADLGVTNPAPAGRYLERDYTVDGFEVGYDFVSHIGGGFIPDGTNCVIYFGDKCETGGTYGYFQSDNISGANPYRGTGSGYHAALGSNYSLCYWAYDLDDLEEVRLGTRTAASVVPYAYGDISMPLTYDSFEIGGVAYDRANKKVYVINVTSDRPGGFRLPLIHCYSHA